MYPDEIIMISSHSFNNRESVVLLSLPYFLFPYFLFPYFLFPYFLFPYFLFPYFPIFYFPISLFSHRFPINMLITPQVWE